MLELVLAVATILGGIAAIWYFWDKITGWWRPATPATTDHMPPISAPRTGPEPARDVRPRTSRVPDDYPDFLGVDALPTKPRSFLRYASPREMADVISEVPPLDQRAVAEQLFRGRWVRWSGAVVAIREDDDCYVVSVHVQNCWVALAFPLGSKREIDQLRKGDQLKFEAQVLKFDGQPPHVELVRAEFVVCSHPVRARSVTITAPRARRLSRRR